MKNKVLPNFNKRLCVSSNEIFLYRGEMTIIPHQGNPQTGIGAIDLTCGGATRHLRIRFEQTSTPLLTDLPASTNGKNGRGTAFMRIPHAKDFHIFVTSAMRADGVILGESSVITCDHKVACKKFELYLNNFLVPEENMRWEIGDYIFLFERTPCAYNLTRLSLPNHEINLTHKLSISRKDKRAFPWIQVGELAVQLCDFLGFANCSKASVPVMHGFLKGKLNFLRFKRLHSSPPTNRRSWATHLDSNSLRECFDLFLSKTKNMYWYNVFQRAFDWQILAETSNYESSEQAVFTTQMLLEMLSYVILVEDSGVLSEDGYSKLPAADRITFLCSHSGQDIRLRFDQSPKLEEFCKANNIRNSGELITSLRNKLIHPTKKNREYLDKVPEQVYAEAVELGLQIASLASLRVLGYKGLFFDCIDHKKKSVPWSSPGA